MKRHGVLPIRRMGLFCTCAVVLAFSAIAVPIAGAATPGTSYGFVGDFGSGLLTTQGPYSDAGAVAVDNATGNLLVADPYAGVYVYPPNSTTGSSPLTSFSTGGFPKNIAIDPTNGAVYVRDLFSGAILKFTSDGAAVPTYAADPTFNLDTSVFSDQTGQLAVDPVTHDLLVGDPAARDVLRFSSIGAFVSSFDGSDTSDGKFKLPGSIAVAPNGNIYVVDEGGIPRVEEFSPTGASLRRLATTDRVSAVAVDASSGEAVVSEALDSSLYPCTTHRPRIEGFSATGQHTFTARFPAAAIGTESRGLAVDGVNGRIYGLTDGNDCATGTEFIQVSAFARGVQAGLDAPQASQIQTTSMHLATQVATGGRATDVNLEYCPTSASCDAYPFSDPGDADNPWTQLPVHSGVTGAGPNGTAAIEDDLTGLDPNRSYLVRAYATNGSTETVSAETQVRTLIAPPDAQTRTASDIGVTSVELNGAVDAKGAPTTYHFDYGLTAGYGQTSPAGADATAGSGRGLRAFGRNIQGLAPGTTYHYRIVAHNDAGTANGADATFTTAASAAPTRAYEQVTPAEKDGGSVNPAIGFDVKPDGSAVEYPLLGAPQDAPSSAQFPRYVSRRGSTDWSPWAAIDPPFSTTRFITASPTAAISSDFAHALAISNRRLAVGGTDGAANLYIEDLANGSYTFVGSSTTSGALSTMIGLGATTTYVAGAPDFSWVVIASRVPLLPGAPSVALYKWTTTAGLSLVSRLPGGAVPQGDLQLLELSQGAVRSVSSDGSAVFFALKTGPNTGVYRNLNGTVTALSVSRIPGDPATPQPGWVAGVSPDGRYAVFASGRLLAAAPAGQRSLYQYDAQDQSIRYIGSLVVNAAPYNVLGVGDDAQTVYYNGGSNTVAWRNGATHIVTADHPEPDAFLSPNGRYIAYKRADGDVHVYDADSQSDACASCLGDGSVGGDASLPLSERNVSNRLPQAVLDDGSVFFTTPHRLTITDHNGSDDVYQYRQGRVTLISPGTGSYSARFADATPDGRDVFFTTDQGLVGQDLDEAPDLYDARLGGGFPSQSPVVQAPCQKADCAEPSPGPVASPSAPSQGIGAASVRRRSNARRVTVRVRGLRFTAKALHISFAVNGQGRIRVTGSRVNTTVRDVSRAGTYSLVVRLSRKAAGLQRHHRKFKITAKITAYGGWGTASARISRTLNK